MESSWILLGSGRSRLHQSTVPAASNRNTPKAVTIFGIIFFENSLLRISAPTCWCLLKRLVGIKKVYHVLRHPLCQRPCCVFSSKFAWVNKNRFIYSKFVCNVFVNCCSVCACVNFCNNRELLSVSVKNNQRFFYS